MYVAPDPTRERVGPGEVVMGFAAGLIECDGEVQGTPGDRLAFVDPPAVTIVARRVLKNDR